MLLDVKYKADWAGIRLRKQAMINKGVVRENKTRVPHLYTPGSKVLYTLPGIIPKMSQPRTGPWEVKQVFPKSGTVSIQRGSVTDTVNIRNISPFFEKK